MWSGLVFGNMAVQVKYFGCQGLDGDGGYKSLKRHEKQAAAGQCFKPLEWMFNKYTAATA